MTYEDNKQAFISIIETRKYESTETERSVFWIQDHENQVKIQKNKDPKSLQVDNPNRLKAIFIPMDGETGVFYKSKPIVKDENHFKYLAFSNGRYEEKTVSACECLLIDYKWRFFELKTEAFTQGESQAAQEREKASLQLSRTITFFKEQAKEKGIVITSVFEAVTAFPAGFPKQSAASINRGLRFFKKFDARLIEVDIKLSYKMD